MSLIGNTTTKGGLQIQAGLDEGSYPTGREVTEDQMARIAIERDKFHGEWNYTVSPETLINDLFWRESLCLKRCFVLLTTLTCSKLA